MNIDLNKGHNLDISCLTHLPVSRRGIRKRFYWIDFVEHFVVPAPDCHRDTGM